MNTTKTSFTSTDRFVHIGVGITLTASSNVAFLEMGWTPADHAQAEDRAHRLGHKNQVNCYYLLAKDTIDEDIHALIENKRKVFNAAADGGDEKIRRKDTRSLVDDVTNTLYRQIKKKA